MLKGRVIDPATVNMFDIKELLEKIENQGWTHLFVCPLPVMYGEAMLHFYKNFKVLEDGTVSSKVRRVDLVLDTKLLEKILIVPVEGFDTYVLGELPELGEKVDVMYLTSKYTQKREKLTAKKVIKGEMEPIHKFLFEFVNKCLSPRSQRRHEDTYLDMEVMKVMAA